MRCHATRQQMHQAHCWLLCVMCSWLTVTELSEAYIAAVGLTLILLSILSAISAGTWL
jgi:hypothetical protein